MALSLKRLGKRFLEEINPFDGKGNLDFNKPVKRQSVSQSAPLLKPQVQQRQFNQPRNIFQASVDRPQFKQPQYQAPTDPIRAKQAQQVQELTDRFRAGQITDEQRQTAAQAILGTQPKAVVKLKGVKGGVESVKDRSLFDAQQQEGYRQAIKPVTSRLQKTQDWVNSSDKKAGFQWDSAGDYGRFAANLIPGMAQGLIEAPIKTGQGVSGERVKNGKVEKMNLVQRGGALADSVISTAGLGIGGSATLLKGAAGGLVKTGLKETARKILKDAGVEGTEELVQAFANDLSDDGTINTDPKAYAQAFGLGALGGGMMSGAGKGTQAVRNNLETNIPKIANDNRGIVAGPLAGDFSKQKQAGRVFEGVDGKPRFEVSDEGAKLRPEAFNPTNKLTDLEAQRGMMLQMKELGVNNPDIDARLKTIPEEIRQAKKAATSSKNLKLSDVLDHEQMYAQYPDLKDVKVKVVNNRSFETLAVYDARTNTVEVNKKRLDTDPEKVKATILHEVQHAIQEKEGFASGGYDKNMDTYKNLAGEAEARAVASRMNMTEGERYKTPDTNYRSTHQITDGVSVAKTDVDSLVGQIKSKYGLTNYDQADIKKLKAMVANPEADVKIYRASPANELNSGDWVTTSKDYANDIKRQNGGKVYEHTVKAKDLNLPKNIEDNPSLARFSAFQYSADARPQSTFYDSLDVPKEDLIIRDGSGKAMSVDKTNLSQEDLDNLRYGTPAKPKTETTNKTPDMPSELTSKIAKSSDTRGTPLEQVIFKEVKNSTMSNGAKNKIYNSMPDYKGWDKVFKPYGEQGKGFYYSRTAETNTSVDPTAPQVGKTVVGEKIPTRNMAESKISSKGGYVNVDNMPLAQRNAYASGELGKLGLNKDYIYKEATKKGIDLNPYLKEMDGGGDSIDISTKLMDDLQGKNVNIPQPPKTVAPVESKSVRLEQIADEIGGLQDKTLEFAKSVDAGADKVGAKQIADYQKNQAKIDTLRQERRNLLGEKGDKERIANPTPTKPTVTKKPTLQDALDGKSTKKVVESAVKPVVTAKTTKPKVALKEASSKKPKVELKEPKSIDEILYEDTPQFEERNKSLGQTLSPDRYIRENITQPLEQAINTGISKIPGVRRLAQGVSREAGVSPELLQQKRLLRGGVEKGKLVRESISELGDGLTIQQKTKAWATLDPEQASKVGIEQPTKLTARETQYRDKLAQIQTEITSGNLSRDLINEQQAANPSYIKRGYSVFEENSDASKAYNQTRQSLLKQFKGRKDVNEDLIDSAITDPGYLVAKKAAESHAAWAMVDYGNYLVESGLASDTKQSGMRQLPNSKIYGEAAGKYVPTNVSEDFTGFQYNNGVINAYNDLITAYDNLGIRKAKKELLTVFNPAVRVGNQFSNRVVFANMNGINPIQFEKNYLEAGKQISEKGQLYREAIEQGLTGIDVTQADFAERIAQYADDPNMAIRAIEWTKKSYSAADDKARIAAYITHRKRGYSPEEAASLTQRGFQDYKSVGFFYDMAAKTPFIGNAFVRFAGDAVRIAKNAAVDHPLRSIATIALWSTFTGATSRLSGETLDEDEARKRIREEKGVDYQPTAEEISKMQTLDRKTREQRFGAPSIPFTDISMTVQTPFGEVNVARFLPFYQLNDIQNPLARFSPIQANPLKPEGWQDPLLGQVGQLIADKDFRGKSIKDPENTGQFIDELPKDQQLKNQARFVATQNVPLGREADALISAAQGKPDIYGKTRSVPQALGRAGGVKIEQFGSKEAKKTRETNAYFKEKERIDKEIAGLPKKEQEAYKRLTGYSKLREQVDNEFDPGTKRYKKAPVYDFPEDKWKDYSPGLYDKIKKFKERENKKQGTPIQPEFDERLSKEFRKQLINNKSLAPGEDVEADARMYSSSEWDTYEQIKQEYKDAASKYYPDDGKDDFVDELVKHKSAPFPVKGPAKKAYDDAYKLYAEGKGPKPAYNDQVDAEKEAYNNAKLDWTNVERKARGLGPISKEVWDNVTFGFSSDEEKVYKQLKYGKGYGGGKGGRGGKGSQGVGSAYKYAIDLNAGGAVAKPKVKVAKAGPAPVAKKSGGKPKVSLKKSKV